VARASEETVRVRQDDSNAAKGDGRRPRAALVRITRFQSGTSIQVKVSYSRATLNKRVDCEVGG
jgi:hypothetical protein